MERLLKRYYGHRGHGKGDRGHYSHGGQGRVLAFLNIKPEISQKELAYMLDIRKQSLGELLHKLERKGFIERHVSEEDRRAVNVKITPLGKENAEKVGKEIEEKKDIFEVLNEEERENFVNYMNRLIEALEAETEKEYDRDYEKEGAHHHYHAHSYMKNHRRHYKGHIYCKGNGGHHGHERQN